MTLHTSVPILDSSDPGEARRVAVGLASALGFDAADRGRVALVVTEAAFNVVKHAGQGQLLLRTMTELDDGAGIEVLALDRGPGIADLSRVMQDGYSTAGSPGTGLGALSRLASVLDIYSRPGLGSVLLARVFAAAYVRPKFTRAFEFGAVRLAAPGETACGDDWYLAQADHRAVLAVLDGLGHGEHAASAASAGIRHLEHDWQRAPEELLAGMHLALLATRGAAGSIAELDLDAGEVCFAGVGNVAGFIAWPGGTRNMVSQNGTLGGQIGRLRSTRYPWIRGSSLIMHTDGLTSHTAVDSYPGLLARHPSVIAGVLSRDFHRGRDDATVVVVRESES